SGEALYAAKVGKSEARIDWSRPAVEIDRLIRGLSPFPGAWFERETPRGPVRVKALGARLEPELSGPPGEVLDGALAIGTGSGAVRLTRLQREGKPALEGEAFLRGAPLAPGTHLR